MTQLSIVITAASLAFGLLKRLLLKVLGDAKSDQRKSNSAMPNSVQMMPVP
jgi:hypothetical protein